MTLWTALLVYAVGFVAVQIVVQLALRGEPTAHGQAVGTQMGCIVGLAWPVALPFAAMALLFYGIRAALIALRWWGDGR